MPSQADDADLPGPAELQDLQPDGGDQYNRLVFEDSPYLRQHAMNPVDWYPWGDAAMERAQKEDRPIFLSIGYSTCRWCHVMERESFEDDEVADLLNRCFVPVKVDREERPDLDQVYMEACQAMTGQGGWPLNLILTPEGAPFFATTYLPPEDRGRRAGLKTVLRQLHRMWDEEREKVEENARKVRAALTPEKPPETVDMGPGTLEKAADQFYERYDEQHGGFGHSPKFPSPHNLQFLLRWWYRSDESRAREMVEHTLDAMQRGGIYDQVGGGFHRYSTDRRWLLPHFEKMLYDQATHMMSYARAYQVTGENHYARTVRDIADYLGRDMTSSDGAFYAAEDAESEGEEGEFYVWTLEEWMEVLGQTEGKLFGEIFSITEEGNYRDESTGERNGRNIPHRQRSFEEEARERDMDLPQLLQRWDESRRKLLEERSDRIRPHRDEKVVTAWNGLMIAGLAVGGQALGDERLYQRAENAADCVLEKLVNEQGRLMRYYRDARSDVPGFLDDYAFLALGLLEMYETHFDIRHLKSSLSIARQMLDLFWDDNVGGLAMVGHDAETPLVSPHQVQDGALPSSNSVALSVLLRLALICDDKQLREYADRLMKSRSGEVLRVPSAYAGFLCGVDCALGPNREIVVAGDPANDHTQEMCSVVKSRFLPRSVWLRSGGCDEKEQLAEIAPYTRRMEPVDAQPAAYVCQNKTCHEPVSTPEELAGLLEEL